MGWWGRVRLWRRDRIEADYDEELRFHLDMREQRNVEQGLAHVEARRAARVRFGNPAVLRERMREIDLMLLPQTVWQDLRFGARMLARNPGFAFVAVFVLSVGIGMNTAAFTAYQAFFARQLDAVDPGSMVNLAVVEHSGATNPNFSYPDYEAFRDQLRGFSGVIAVTQPKEPTLEAPGGVEIHEDDGAGSLIGKLGLLPTIGTMETAMTLAVSENYFSVLGVKALRGRLFGPEDAAELKKAPAVVISENFWQRRFLSDPAILGKTVRLNGAAFTVMGVAPHNFVGTFVAAPDFWLPLPLEPLVNRGDALLTNREQECCRLHARLRPGLTMQQAQAEMNLVAERLRKLHDPKEERAQPVTAVVWPGSPFPVQVKQNRAIRLMILFVMTAVGMVLVVACANVASLQLARAAARQNELGMRLSLGASRMRIVRQLLTESVLLGVSAGALAFLLSWALLQAAVVLIADAFPEEYGTFIFHVTPDLSIFAFVAFVSLSAGFLFGLAPALESSRSAAAAALRANAATSPKRGRRLRNFLIGTQVAVSSVLVIAGSLLIHSALRAVEMETGYDAAHVVSLYLQFPGTPEYTPAHEQDLVRELRERVAGTPGVSEVTSGRAPDDGGILYGAVSLNGETPTRSNVKGYLYYTWVEPNYFRLLGIPFEVGRGWAAQDGEASAVVSETVAKKLWPGANPLGRTFRMGTDGFYRLGSATPDGPVWRVVGVARDVRGVLMDGSDAAMIYLPLGPDHVQEVPLLIQARSDPTRVIKGVSAAMAEVDPHLTAHAWTLEQMLRQTEPFLVSTLAAVVAAGTGLLGLLLATVGIYGTVSYIVVLRTREVGIRMALGAKKGDVLALILRESVRPVLAGLGAGIVLGAGGAYLLRGLLYGIRSFDPVSFGGVSVLFLAVALLASVIPSRRAMRIEPLTALRYE